jgi:hypothetical protein
MYENKINNSYNTKYFGWTDFDEVFTVICFGTSVPKIVLNTVATLNLLALIKPGVVFNKMFT